MSSGCRAHVISPNRDFSEAIARETLKGKCVVCITDACGYVDWRVNMFNL